MAEDQSAYKHDKSDKKLDHAAAEADHTKADHAKAAAHPHGDGHDPVKTAQHDDAGKDRLFEGRVQRDDADKESDRNRQEKDIAKHHHDPASVAPIADHDTHSKKAH